MGNVCCFIHTFNVVEEDVVFDVVLVEIEVFFVAAAFHVSGRWKSADGRHSRLSFLPILSFHYSFVGFVIC